ncbi:F0F1 ATP synthase subunit epsilon [Chryseobacterium lacus]|uniref:F0F1 ATP synthase subunit epsilon n=1 Tax=Chryseobacterium lacus TaxID=2058346 RepID=A0A368MXY5_9FLAO|nr:F0F1 ATP synthase subunit epsilon [Chryseobacterium lacus]MBF6610501.1 F0F1 ATP synthase subunit epsilon [Chryseobacterium sp.]RCU42713.1 F0F1 ATP synthase subunit epsilon [Chryseobacterium lacus]RST27275.1 F0F1 ATP synthase subunit epsilon [Chryseobacterium lacus]
MNIKILTPEFVVFDGDVKSVLLPGKSGEFHVMKNHAAIVASLKNGKIKLYTDKINEKFAEKFKKENEKESVFSFKIKSGVMEFSNNKGIILAE